MCPYSPSEIISLKDLVKTSIFGILIFCWLLPGYSRALKNQKNIDVSAEVEAEGADIPVTNVNDEDFTTR
ncbi:hypothetical protein CMK14_07330 [Candidatus Poribacteria bacterium]|nr:hypothetical protein [Candidatus Poribacteria bacterium]